MTSTVTRKEYEDSRKRVQLYEGLKRLSVNRDFIDLINMGYLREYPLKLTEDISSTQVGSKEESSLLAELRAVSSFRKYLETLEASIGNDYETITLYETTTS